MREYGVNEETISNVLSDMKSDVKEVVVRGSSSKDNINNNQGRSSILGYEGDTNTFYGLQAGYSNITGANNTFIGSGAGYFNTTSNNTFLGYYAGYGNTTGNLNTFIGRSAGYQNTTGFLNTFIGHFSGFSNSTGSMNTFLGVYAGNFNTTGYNNTFIGKGAGQSSTTGYNNTFLGQSAGYSNTIGYSNTFLGCEAGNVNTGGYENTFIGRGVGSNNSTGNSNTFLGFYAGSGNTTGNYNTLLGYGAGNSNTTGIGNVFLGFNAGKNETGSNKLYISNSDTSFPLIYGEFDNNIVTINGKLGIGTKTPDYPMELETTGQNAAFTTKRTDGATNFMSATATYAQFGSVSNHPVRILVNSTWKMKVNTDGSLGMANGATCTTGGVWTNASSRSLKENIQSLYIGEALDALNKLNPVKYNYKVDETDKHVGFIAEDVPDLVATADRKGLSPMDITAVLTRVVQEQQKMIQEQQQVNQEYKTILSDLQERIAKMEKDDF